MTLVNVDPSEMARIAAEIFVPKIANDMGPAGTATLTRLLEEVRRIHLAVSTERISLGLTVLCGMDSDQACLLDAPAYFADASSLTAYFDGLTELTVQVIRDGLLVWTTNLSSMPEFEFIGYKYTLPHVEAIFTRSNSYDVPQIAASPSYFGIPYFRDLRQSLEQYGETWIKNSVCEIFNDAWLDEHRTVFKPRPEFRMRRSLQRHLRSGLREHTGVAVMPEQNINETRPVDIKVTWGSNRVALIEIKWLGKSARLGDVAATQEHYAARAREGSTQLANYLDEYHKEVPHEEARGYLAVYDARRRNVSLPPTRLGEADAFYYRHKEIDYDDTVISRPDFERPIRFFCEIAH